MFANDKPVNLNLMCFAGAPDGRIQHRCPGVEAKLLRYVRAGKEQRLNERILTQGLTLIVSRFVPSSLRPLLQL